MKVGDYVRTKRGQIHKITDLKGYYENNKLIEDRQYVHIDNHFSGWDLGQFKELIIKSSPNIIDLIEVGDIVNYGLLGGGMVIFKKDGEITTNTILFSNLKEKDIKKVITKEQIENLEYEVK